MALQDDTQAGAVEPSAALIGPVSAEVALKAENIIKNHVMAAATASMAPVPLLDIAAVAAVQVMMIRKLAALHDRSFSEDAVRNVISALGGGILGHGAGVTTAVSLTKLIPGFGWMLGMISMPVVTGATTYAIGQVFERHFENGGSIFDISVDSVRGFFNEQLVRGRKVASAVKADVHARTAPEQSAA